MSMYMEDHSGRFPSRATADQWAPFAGQYWTYRWPGDPRPDKDKWYVCDSNEFKFIQLSKYVKSWDIWICPSPKDLYALKNAYGYRCSWWFVTFEACYDRDYPDTPFQTWNSSNWNDPSNGIGRTISDVIGDDRAKFGRYTSPSTKIYAMCYGLGPDVAGNTETYAGSGRMEPPSYPHKDGSIYIYCDGHAQHQIMGCGWAPLRYTNHKLDRPHPRVN